MLKDDKTCIESTQTPLEDEEEVQTVFDESGNVLELRLLKSFRAKLSQADEDAKAYYNELKNYVLSYKGTHSRISWHYDSVKLGREHMLLKFSIRGKTLCVYYALDAESLDSKYKVEAAKSRKYADTPCQYRIKNDRRAQYAKELIDMVMGRINAVQGAIGQKNYALPRQSSKALREQGMIKEVRIRLGKKQ